MKELIVALMVWLSPQIGHPVPENMPQIQKLDKCSIQVIWNIIEQKKNLECLEEDSKTIKPIGLYLNPSKTLILHENWSSQNLKDLSYLVHGLVQFMVRESKSRKLTRCENIETAKIAYDSQKKFLESAGVDALEIMEMNELSYAFVTGRLHYNRECK